MMCIAQMTTVLVQVPLVLPWHVMGAVRVDLAQQWELGGFWIRMQNVSTQCGTKDPNWCLFTNCAQNEHIGNLVCFWCNGNCKQLELGSTPISPTFSTENQMCSFQWHASKFNFWHGLCAVGTQIGIRAVKATEVQMDARLTGHPAHFPGAQCRAQNFIRVPSAKSQLSHQWD